VEVMLDGDDLVVVGADRLTDSEVERLRVMKGELLALLRPTAKRAADWRAFYDERATTAEYDGGLTRVEAEARAFNLCVIEWLNRHPIRSSPERCCWCGGMEREDNVLLPFGVEPTGHAWLHNGCWRPWRDSREREAVAALAVLTVQQTEPAPPRCDKGD
jgi:hypothetical protein